MSEKNMIIETSDWEGYSHHVAKTLLPGLRETEVVAALYNGPDATDVKMATEIGYALLLGKPIVLIASYGTSIPDQLRQAAAAVVIGDMGDPQTRLDLATALDVILTNSQVEEGESD